MTDPLKIVSQGEQQGLVSPSLAALIRDFYPSYVKAAQSNGYKKEEIDRIVEQYFKLIIEQLSHPFSFDIFHQRIDKPFNYFRFGLDLIRPLIIFPKSTVSGLEHLDQIEASLAKGDNVILLSNHQTEPDPQAINLLLEKTHPKVAENIIFVAGQRVLNDPMAVPLSKGVNLLCIYSKNYVESPPELKHEKLMHNRRTMKKMAELLGEGGKCIYVASSGGRDRPDSSGRLHVAPFNGDGIEMFRLMAAQSGKETHFHTLALSTYNLQPPPNKIEMQLGEKRAVYTTPVHLAFGPAIDMEACVKGHTDKTEKRQARADHIWNIVNKTYENIEGHHHA